MDTAPPFSHVMATALASATAVAAAATASAASAASAASTAASAAASAASDAERACDEIMVPAVNITPTLAQQMLAGTRAVEERCKLLDNSLVASEPTSLIEPVRLDLRGSELLCERMILAGLPAREVLSLVAENHTGPTLSCALAGHAVAYAAMDAMRQDATQGKKCLEKVRAFEVYVTQQGDTSQNCLVNEIRKLPDLVEIAPANHYYPAEKYWVFKPKDSKHADEPPLIVTVKQSLGGQDNVFSQLKSIDFSFARCYHDGSNIYALSKKVSRHIEKRKIGACESYTCEFEKLLWHARLYADFRELEFRGFPRVIESKMTRVGTQYAIPEKYSDVATLSETDIWGAIASAADIVDCGYKPLFCYWFRVEHNYSFWRFELKE